MKKVFLSPATLIVLLVFFSCKKKDSPQQTVAQKLQYTWMFINEIDNFHDGSGGDHPDTVNAKPGDFITFNSNGTVSSQFNGSTHNSTYSLIGDNQILENGITFTIQTLTSTQLVLYVREDQGSNQYEEETINLER